MRRTSRTPHTKQTARIRSTTTALHLQTHSKTPILRRDRLVRFARSKLSGEALSLSGHIPHLQLRIATPYPPNPQRCAMHVLRTPQPPRPCGLKMPSLGPQHRPGANSLTRGTLETGPCSNRRSCLSVAPVCIGKERREG